MNIAQRVKEIMFAPKTAWPVIEAEQADATSLYTQYIMIIALIPAVAGFIGLSVVGVSSFDHTVRVPLLGGIVHMVVSYILSLVLIYVLALLTDRLAPNFGGEQNPINALKLIAYSSTPGMVGGVFSLVPSLSTLGLLASLYSLYLLFVGVPVMMKAPQEKALSYTCILLVGGLVSGALLGMISMIFL